MLNISESVRHLRNTNRYTQEQLAELCGVSRQAVAKWEAGINCPDLAMILKLSRLFRISTDELLTGEKSVPNGKAAVSERKLRSDNEKIVNRALEKALSCEDPDEEINRFISSIGTQIGADRVYVFERSPEGSYKNTYEWCNRGIKPQKEYLQAIPSLDMSLWLNAFSKGEHIVIEDLERIAGAQPAVYKWLKPQGIRSLLVYPLFGGRNFIGVDNPAPAFMAQTSALIEIIVHFTETMLKHRDLMQELKRTTFQNTMFSRLDHAVQYRINMKTGAITYDGIPPQEMGYSFRATNLDELRELFLQHPEFGDHVMIDGIQRAAQSGENISVEFLSYKSSRKIRWNRLSVSPFIDGSGTVLQLYGVLQDVSAAHRIVGQYNDYISRHFGGIHICYLSRPFHLDYASDELCSFLGYTRDEFERIAAGKYSNVIADEDRAAFDGYVKRLASASGTESCEYHLIKKDGSKVLVWDTMESFLDGSGIMYGYAYVIERAQLQAMLNMAEETEKQQLAVIDRQYEVLEALGKDYLNVFSVWPDDDRAQIVFLNGYITKGMRRESAEYMPYYRFCRQYVQDCVHPEDREKMLVAMRPDTVRKAFSKNDEYNVVYRVLDNGETHFYQMKYIRIKDSGNDPGFRVVAGFKNVDKVIGEERARNEALQDRLNIINAILQVFVCAYYFNRFDDTFNELSNRVRDMSALIGKSGNFTENRERMKRLFPDKAAFKTIDDFLDPATLDNRLNGGNYLSEQVAISGFGWYELYILIIDRSNGKAAHGIVAARDITGEKRKENELLHSLGSAGKREKAAIKAAYTDALTGVMNRNAFEKAFNSLGDDSEVGFIYCDVNNLKKTNDSMGHEEGDQLLKQFSALLKKQFSNDCIYRTGGDEFVCMIAGISHERFTQRTEEFLQEVSLCGNIASTGSSYGKSDVKNALLKEAESRMYVMKGTGRDSNA